MSQNAKRKKQRKRLIRRFGCSVVLFLLLAGLVGLCVWLFWPEDAEEAEELPPVTDTLQETPEIVVPDPVTPEDAEPAVPLEPDPDVNSDDGRFFYSNPYQSAEAEAFAALVVEIARNEPENPYDADGGTKYGALFGDPYAQWCAEFVMWCLREAEEEMDVTYTNRYYPWEYSGYRCVTWYRKKGWFMERAETKYRPRKGDVILFDYDFDGNCDHTGLVTGLRYDRQSGQLYVQTVEGNILDDPTPRLIRERELLLDTPIIFGYGTFYE